MTNKNRLNPLYTAFMSQTLVKLFSFSKISFIVGSFGAFFTLSGIFIPLSGAWAGIAGSLLTCAAGLAIRFLIHPLFSLSFLAYHIPGLCASLFWATNSKLFKIALPMICMLLFIAHPVGSQAALYALFWIVPLWAAFYSHDLFATALGSTFTAHAVGSVIWLYSMPMNADYWLMLIPAVVIERLFFACAMVIVYRVSCTLLNKITFSGMKTIPSSH